MVPQLNLGGGAGAGAGAGAGSGDEDLSDSKEYLRYAAEVRLKRLTLAASAFTPISLSLSVSTGFAVPASQCFYLPGGCSRAGSCAGCGIGQAPVRTSHSLFRAAE